ncbi:MAG: type II toxin-antitoxin system VapC family toxin [Acidobacteriota bacterium]
MNLYLDSSAFVKLFLTEEFSEEVREATVQATRLCTSRLAWPETVSAFARMCREDRITQYEFFRLMDCLGSRWQEINAVVEVDANLLSDTPLLMLAHPLRAHDAIHLASAKAFAKIVDDDLRFAAYDEALARAAHASGFDVLSDPRWKLFGGTHSV